MDCKHEFMELCDNKPQWICQQCETTLSAINTSKLYVAEQQLHAANARIISMQINWLAEVANRELKFAKLERVVDAARTVIDARNGAINLNCYDHGRALNALEKALAELEAAP